MISNSLDIDFIHGDIHGRLCKNEMSLRLFMGHCGLIFFFFHTTLFHHIYISFVTTRQSSTYKQSIMDFKVRTLFCIRTLVTSDNTYSKQCPKGDWKWIDTVRHRHNAVNFPQFLTTDNP